MHNTWTNGCGHFSNRLLSTKAVGSQIWPTGCGSGPCHMAERSSYFGPSSPIQYQSGSSTAFAMAQWFYQWSSTEIENELYLICHFQMTGREWIYCVQKDSEIVPGLSRKICHNQLAMFKIGTKGDIVAHTSHFCHFCFRIHHQHGLILLHTLKNFHSKA